MFVYVHFTLVLQSFLSILFVSLIVLSLPLSLLYLPHWVCPWDTVLYYPSHTPSLSLPSRLHTHTCTCLLPSKTICWVTCWTHTGDKCHWHLFCHPFSQFHAPFIKHWTCPCQSLYLVSVLWCTCPIVYAYIQYIWRERRFMTMYSHGYNHTLHCIVAAQTNGCYIHCGASV